MIAAQFLRDLIDAVPYAIHTMLTDNGIQFANMAHHKYAFHHIFDRSATSMASSTASRRSSIPGPTGKSNG